MGLLKVPPAPFLYIASCLRRLKVHYRAPPGGRGSGVERGHGEELPHCPLCLASLDDVKYHKCSAGPAAQASVSDFGIALRCAAGFCRVTSAPESASVSNSTVNASEGFFTSFCSLCVRLLHAR